MKFFEVINLEKFQHYKDRTPPWIKLYNELLDDYEFGCLQDASKLHLILIWLLASRSDNKIPYDSKWVGNRINATSKVDLDELQRVGFIKLIESASEVLADCKQNACLETEGETEEDNKNNKGKITLENLSAEHVQDWLAEKRSKGKFIKHDEKWVLEKFRDYCLANGKKYKDYIAAYRNAFNWEQCKPEKQNESFSRNNQNTNQRGFSGRRSTSEQIADGIAEIAAKYGDS